MLTLLSWVCIVTGTLLGLPQVVRLLRERSSAGLSLTSWQIWLAVCLAWTFHGLLLGSATQIVPNGIGVLECLAILLLTRRDRGLGLLPTFWLAAVLTAVALAIRLGLGPVGFGLFMVLPQSVAVVGQLVDIVRCRDLRGVSPVYLGLVVLLQAAWIGYGRLLPDDAAVVTSSVMVVLSSTSLAWYLARRAGLRPLWPTGEPDVTQATVR